MVHAVQLASSNVMAGGDEPVDNTSIWASPVGPAADGAVALLALGGVSLSILGMIAVVWRVILLFGALAGHDHEPQNTAATQLSSLDIVNDIDWVDPSTPTKLDNQHTRTF